MSNAKPTTSSLIVLRGSSFSSVSSDKSSSSSDFDRYSYASSSGQTTPEDGEEKTFELDVRHMAGNEEKLKLRPVLRSSIAMKKAATAIHARPRALTTALNTVTRALTTVFRKKRLHEEIYMASPIRERFGRRISVRIRPEEFYSLPNRYFSVHDLPMKKAETVGHHTGRRIASMSGPLFSVVHNHKPSRRPRSQTTFDTTEFVEAAAPLLSPVPSSLPAVAHVSLADPTPEERESSQRILISILPRSAVCSLLVVFRSGYLESTQGIRRFAHWADCAFHHAMIFLALVVALVWYKAAVGVPVACGLMARFMYIWSGFHFDSKVPLGWDDRQSLYLLAKGMAFANNTVLIKGCEGEARIARLRDD
ncbi:uncharacterized protein EDB91DRAFT_1344184 [Suillus paluster]|uniref:uncharacterized protein n=1 Tax=Suillus paluster TaxID=48578 RepID=UPI001B881AEB|nr:uncharacterized protein EDB91DRAFT_1344184 [Suillus paluster]KAG1750556.1 hypothetical protein EDB91DRAFT_1344184 [Suillus paluster]